MPSESPSSDRPLQSLRRELRTDSPSFRARRSRRRPAHAASARSTAGCSTWGSPGSCSCVADGRLVRLWILEPPRRLGRRLRASQSQARRGSTASRRRYRLSRDPRVNDDQRMEICLRRDVPDLARYLLAEAVSTDAVAHDPRSFCAGGGAQRRLARLAAASCWRGGWRTGPLAAYAIPREALDELAQHADPMIGLWANSALALLAAGLGHRDGRRSSSKRCARVPDPAGELAATLAGTRASQIARRRRRERHGSDRGHRMAAAMHHPAGGQDLGAAGRGRRTGDWFDQRIGCLN